MSNTSIRRFIVSNGKDKPRVMARSPFLAAVEAVRGGELKSLGLILEVREPKGEIGYVSTEKVLRAAKMPKAAAILAAMRKAAFKTPRKERP